LAKANRFLFEEKTAVCPELLDFLQKKIFTAMIKFCQTGKTEELRCTTVNQFFVKGNFIPAQGFFTTLFARGHNGSFLSADFLPILYVIRGRKARKRCRKKTKATLTRTYVHNKKKLFYFFVQTVQKTPPVSIDIHHLTRYNKLLSSQWLNLPPSVISRVWRAVDKSFFSTRRTTVFTRKQ